MWFLFLLWLLELGALGYYNDYQHEKDVDDQQIPIVEENLSDHAKRHLVGMDKQFQEMDSEVLAEEMETHDVQEVQQDGNGIGDNVDDVDESLELFFVNDARGETVIHDGQQVDAEDDRQVEAHAVEVELQGLPCVQLVEELQVEQIEHPTADADYQQGGYQPIEQ